MQLSNREFVRRFAQHILPLRFVRIRHYGMLSSTWKRGKLQTLQSDLRVKRPETKPKTLLRKCPCCKTGTMITIEVFGKRGPPQKYLIGNPSVPVNWFCGQGIFCAWWIKMYDNCLWKDLLKKTSHSSELKYPNCSSRHPHNIRFRSTYGFIVGAAHPTKP